MSVRMPSRTVDFVSNTSGQNRGLVEVRVKMLLQGAQAPLKPVVAEAIGGINRIWDRQFRRSCPDLRQNSI